MACEADEACVNGGWLHPECTDDLCNMTRAQIDNMTYWVCQDCRQNGFGEAAIQEQVPLAAENID